MDSVASKYRVFLEVVHLGSFTKAAEALGYTQSGVSRIVADLEREWGVKLLERSRGGVRLTSEGHELLPWVQRVCDEQNRLQARIDALSGLESGLIRIGSITSAATHWLPSIIDRFHADYPHIDYEIMTGNYDELERLVAEGQVDCGFTKLPTKHAFDTVFLERDELKVVMAADHPLAKAERVPIGALADYPFMAVDKRGHLDIAEELERAGVNVHVAFTAWDDYAAFAMVEKGLGVGVHPALTLRRIPFNVVVKSLETPVYRELGLVLRSRSGASLAVRRFIDYLGFRNEA